MTRQSDTTLLIVAPSGEAARIASWLDGDDVRVREASDVRSAVDALAAHPVDCVVCVHAPPTLDGVAALRSLRERNPTLPVVLATEAGEAGAVLDADPADVLSLAAGDDQPAVVANRLRAIASRSRDRHTYREVFERATDGIVIHDAETGAVVEANRRVYEMLDRDPGTPLSLADLVAGVDDYTAADLRSVVAAVAAEGERTVEWVAGADGAGPRAVEVSLRPATIDGRERVLAFVRDVSGRRRPDDDLRRHRQVLERVAEKAFALDAAGRLTLVTDAFATWLGRERTALEGAAFADVLAGDESPVVREHLARLDAGDAGRTHFEVAFDAADGAVSAAVELAAAAGESERYVGTVTDISRLAEVRTQLAAERDRFARLFESIPDPVVEVERTDSGAVVRSVNPAFEDLFGDGDAVRGAPLRERFPSDADTERLDATTAQSEPTTVEVERETVDGPRDFLFRTVGYAGTGGTERAFGVYTDITEQKERERYLQVLNRVLRHNLRNDLNVMMLSARRLAERVEDPLREEATRLRDTAEELASLSETATEIERAIRRIGPEVGAVDLAPAVRAAVERYAATDSGADVAADVPEALWVRGDETLERAVEELIENAVEHGSGDDRSESDDDVEHGSTGRRSEPDDVVVRVTARETADGDRIVLRVSDDGPGIPDREWDLVTGEEEITQLSHGSGLGLWLVRWSVRSSGGELRRLADPEETVVELRLRPAAPADRDASPQTHD